MITKQNKVLANKLKAQSQNSLKIRYKILKKSKNK